MLEGSRVIVAVTPMQVGMLIQVIADGVIHVEVIERDSTAVEDAKQAAVKAYELMGKSWMTQIGQN